MVFRSVTHTTIKVRVAVRWKSYCKEAALTVYGRYQIMEACIQ